MKRWIDHMDEHGENPRVDAFLADIVEVCRKHGLMLSHEDWQGAFEVETLTDDGAASIEWLMAATDATGRPRDETHAGVKGRT